MSADKITHIIQLGIWGGAESALKFLVEQQQLAGCDVTVILLVSPTSENLVALFEEIGNIRVEAVHLAPDPLPGHPWAKLCAIFKIIPILRARKDGVLHLHNYLAAQLGTAAALWTGCHGVVETVHAEYEYLTSIRWRLFLLPIMKRIIDRYVTVSISLSQYLTRTTGMESVVVYNSCPINSVLDKSEARAQLGLPESTPVVGFAGRLEKVKNISVLLQAVSLLPSDTTLAVLGDGPLRQQLQEQAEKLGIGAKFFGFLPHAWRLFPAFDVLCLPSRREALGSVLIEAMLQKVPVVGSSAPGIAEALNEGRAGLLHEPNDHVMLAKQIKTVLQEKDTTEAQIQRAYAWAKETFAPEKQYKLLMAVYGEVLKNSSRKTHKN